MTRMRIEEKKSTGEEIGARNIDGVGVETYDNKYLVHFLVQPNNTAVLSGTAVKTRIIAMSSIIKGLNSTESSCTNSRESFDQNKTFYRERLEEEESPRVREILERDPIHPDRVQIQTASAREFLFILRFRSYNPETNEVQTGISKVMKLLKNAGFSYCQVSEEDIERLYAIYFIQNIMQVYFDDYDNERFVKEDEYHRKSAKQRRQKPISPKQKKKKSRSGSRSSWICIRLLC